jgi:hypothetical protein
MRLSTIVLMSFLATAACQGPTTVADRVAARCEQARAVAVDAWDETLPAMRAAAELARIAASNCDEPTRGGPPCSGKMSDRFLAQSVTRARLSEAERAREAARGADPLAIRETARDVKDDVAVAGAKSAAENAYAVCALPAGASM